MFAFMSARLSTAAVVTACTDAGMRGAMAAGGVVTFACDGVIELTTQLNVVADTVVDGSGRGITLKGMGATRIFSNDAGRRLTLMNMTLTGGHAKLGGAIHSAGVLVVSNCVFRDNLAMDNGDVAGGAIYQAGGEMSLRRCVLVQNKAVSTGTGANGVVEVNTTGGAGGPGRAAFGGAVWNLGQALIEECYFFGNSVTGATGGIGGSVVCTDFCAYPGGTGGTGGAGAGGALFHGDGDLLLLACTFASNWVAGGMGGTGGIGASAAGASGAGGVGGVGGNASGAGLYAESGRVLATNNTWFANLAAGGQGGTGGTPGSGQPCRSGGTGGSGGPAVGGGLSTMAAAVTLAHNTLGSNAANGGPGGSGAFGTICSFVSHLAPSGATGSGAGGGVASVSNNLAIVSTIFAFNRGGNGFGPFYDEGFNLSSDDSLVFTNHGGWIRLDPRTGDLADNGGPTPTIALLSDSPALDHDARFVGPKTDQRGVDRRQGLGMDAGAFELEQGPGKPACDVDNLRSAVASGGIVPLACDGIYRLTEPLIISRNTTIDATGREVILSGGRGTRVIQILPGAALTLIHVVVQDGWCTNGAGILNDGGELTLIDCVVATNRAVGLSGMDGTNAPQDVTGATGGAGGDGADGAGGGILNLGSLRLTNSIFIGNQAEGGLGGLGGVGGNSPAYLDTVSRCRSLGSGGGGSGGAGAHGLGGAILNQGRAWLGGASFVGNRAIGGPGGAGGRAGALQCFPNSPSGNGGSGGNAGEGRGGAIFNQGFMEISACALSDHGAMGGIGGTGGAGVGRFAGSLDGAHGRDGSSSGGALVNQGTNYLVNVTIANNRATAGCAAMSGGAIANDTWLAATNCTLWSNTLDPGTNAACSTRELLGASIRSGSNAWSYLVNCIVSHPIGASNCAGTMTDGGHNICSDDSAALSAPGSLNGADPRLGPFAYNGGPTKSLALDPRSPALDAADDFQCPAVDQRGVLRPVGSGCDIGAVEGTDGALHPTLDLVFLPSTVPVGDSVTARFNVGNPGARTLSNLVFTNQLPPGLIVAAPTRFTADCDGILQASNRLITWSVESLAAGQTCTIGVEVSALAPGLHTNVAGSVFAWETGFGLVVTPAILGVNSGPVAETGSAFPQSDAVATLTAVVNPYGRPTWAHFAWGTTTNYGQRTEPQFVGDGWESVSLSRTVSGLQADSDYHYRVSATNNLGISHGVDRSFGTPGPGPAGNLVRLDGVDDFVLTPDLSAAFSNSSASVTIELWFRADGPGVLLDERGQLPSIPGWQDTQMEILESGQIKVRIWDLPVISIGTARFATWHHAALRYSSESRLLHGFLDGVAEGVASGTRQVPWSRGYGLYYGFGLGDTAHLGNGGFLRGQIDEIRIWNLARSDQDIRHDRFRRLCGDEPGLICYWRFDETGVRAIDRSRWRYDGELFNGAIRQPSDAPMQPPLSIGRTPQGAVTVSYETCEAGVQILEASADLDHWSALATNINYGPVRLQWLDSAVATLPWRFFRIQSAPP